MRNPQPSLKPSLSEKDILDLVKADEWMMSVLRIAEQLQLPDWMIGAGFIRNKVWDYLHEYATATPLGDIDLIYFDASDLNEEMEKQHEQALKQRLDVPWSVKNQARMYLANGDDPYESSEDAMRYWPETATATAVRLDREDMSLVAPYGIMDLVSLNVKLSPRFTRHIDIYKSRISKKQWQTKWPKLTIHNV